MSRTRAERRHNDFIKAVRKKKIAEHLYGGYYDNLHQYSDNKIHCSCGMCSRCEKTKNKGHHRSKIQGNYAPSYNPSISDIKKIDSMNYSSYGNYYRVGNRKFKYYG